MRPDLVRGLVMMCSPPSARGAIRPSDAMKAFQEKGIEFYQSYIARPEAGAEIMRDVRRFLLGLFYSTSGYCPADKQWRWAWEGWGVSKRPFPIPTRFRKRCRRISARRRWTTTSPNSRATGIQPANKCRYAAIDAGWSATHHSSTWGRTVRQPRTLPDWRVRPVQPSFQCSASTGKAPLSIRSERISAICGTYRHAGRWSRAAGRAT